MPDTKKKNNLPKDVLTPVIKTDVNIFMDILANDLIERKRDEPAVKAKVPDMAVKKPT